MFVGGTNAAPSETAAQGVLDGDEVRVSADQSSAVEDCSEEAAFVKDNSRQTKLADRKQRQKRFRPENRLERLKFAFSLQKSNNDNFSRARQVERFRSERSLTGLLSELKRYGRNAGSDYAFLLSMSDEEQDAQFKQF